jgi:hypothetical protein
MQTETTLDIIVVSYRSRELVRNCLLSLRRFRPDIQTRLFVVDNDSRDGTVELIRAQFPEVYLIPNSTNAGFAVANNQAIRKGSGTYVLTLNPDTRVTEGSLQRMLDLMEAHPEIGISGCRLELEDGTLDHAAKRSFPTPVSALGHFTGLGRREGARGGLAAYRAPEIESGPVDAVNGAFMLIRRAALDDVGLFDEGYWMYVEDLDLCYRFKQAGWLTWYEPSATVFHVKAGTSGRDRPARLNYALHYGMYRFYRQHYADERNPLLNGVIYIGIGVKLAVSMARSGYRRRVAPKLTRRHAH